MGIATKEDVATFTAQIEKAAPGPTAKEVLAAAPRVDEILARPFVYDTWLKRLAEALNGA